MAEADRFKLLFGRDARPPAPMLLLGGIQHLLAVFGGIVTAPLIMAVGMGLSTADTQYILAAALLVSGIATAIQISGRFGVGSGLLAIQGTSFTFIGPVLFAYHGMPAELEPHERLAALFGACALASVITGLLGTQIRRLGRILTPAVTGSTVLLIGLTLVVSTLSNLVDEATTADGPGLRLGVLAAAVFLLTLFLATRRSPWLRLCSVIGGLAIGSLMALVLGLFDPAQTSIEPALLVPRGLPFGLGFDWGAFFILMPVFLVSATESVGDLTATSALSGVSTAGSDYWRRVRGGIVGDAVNSFLAALAGTFPNTTFSQNNGVIRLTGIASRAVGYVVAALLIALGLLPVVVGGLQAMPPAVLYGSTLLLFLLVARAGSLILQAGCVGRRDWLIAACAVVGGWSLSVLAGEAQFLPEQLQMLLQFPVSSGAFLAMALEIILPKAPTRQPLAQSARS